MVQVCIWESTVGTVQEPVSSRELGALTLVLRAGCAEAFRGVENALPELG